MTIGKIICVGCYIRVSSEEQVKHGYSIQAQKESLIEYCKRKGYKITDFYIDEGKSARSKIKNRKEMSRLIEDIKQGKLNRVVFIKLDRWFRNIADYYKAQEILDKYHCDWEATQEDYNTTTSSGRLNLNIRLSIAQDEADRTGDRIRFTFANMVKNGRPIQGSHCMPMGYMVSGEGKDKKVIKDENSSHIVNDMFQNFKISSSIRKTLLYINKKYSLNICYDSLRHYLKNELYTGVYRGVENYCEPYITAEEFLENQKRIKCNVRDNKKKHEYIFSGLVRCSCCGYKMSGFTHRATKPKYNRAYENAAYRCNRSYNSKQCSNRSPILEKKLEQYLLDNIQDIAKKQRIQIHSIVEKEDNTQIIDEEKIKKKIERLTELYVDGKISRERYDLDFEKFTSQLNNANSVKKEKRNLDYLKDLDNKDIFALYDKLTNENKRAFWSKYIDYVERDKDLNYKIHFK